MAQAHTFRLLDRNRARAKARWLARLLVLVRGEAFGLDVSGKAGFGIRNAEQKKK
jgi:hypothetical protein